jgi:hypothetical protein
LTYLHLEEGISCRVRRLAWCNDPESYAGGSLATGRATLAGQVKNPDKERYTGPPGWGLGRWASTSSTDKKKKNTHAKKPRQSLGKTDGLSNNRKLKETYEKWGLDTNWNKTKYLCTRETTHNNLKLDKDKEIEFCQEYKYLGVIFYTSGTDDKEIKSRIIQARKCIACLNGILWSKDIRKDRKLNIYNALIKISLLYGSETWRLTESKKRWVEATEMDALRRSSRISRKDKIRNVTIRQQMGLEKTIIKEIEQN